MRCAEVDFAGQLVVLDAAGVLFWPSQSLLIVSDLHLGKGSFLRLPAHDAADTLARLEAAIGQYRPQQVVCLGDSFHDRRAHARLDAQTRRQLDGLCRAVPHWAWILGNHDPHIAADLPGAQHDCLHIEGIALRHEPEADAQAQIVGHFHPKRTQKLAGHRVTGRCFIVNHRILLMPAFGSYTGGLDCNDAALMAFNQGARRFLLYKDKIWPVA